MFTLQPLQAIEKMVELFESIPVSEYELRGRILFAILNMPAVRYVGYGKRPLFFAPAHLLNVDIECQERTLLKGGHIIDRFHNSHSLRNVSIRELPQKLQDTYLSINTERKGDIFHVRKYPGIHHLICHARKNGYGDYELLVFDSHRSVFRDMECVIAVHISEITKVIIHGVVFIPDHGEYADLQIF